jgi:hypothetical protein
MEGSRELLDGAGNRVSSPVRTGRVQKAVRTR